MLTYNEELFVTFSRSKCAGNNKNQNSIESKKEKKKREMKLQT